MRFVRAKGIVAVFGLLCINIKDFNYGLVFDFKKDTSKYLISIHSFLMRYPFCVLYINSKNKIIDKKIIKPNQVFFAKANARYIVEIPVKYAKKFKIGQVLKNHIFKIT